MNDKHSPQGGMPDDGTVYGTIAPTPREATPMHAPCTPSPIVLKSTPASLPPLDTPRPSDDAMAARFALTSLIKSLPQSSPRPSMPLQAHLSVPPAQPAAADPTPPEPNTPEPAPESANRQAPAFTPFTPAITRPVTNAPATGMQPPSSALHPIRSQLARFSAITITALRFAAIAFAAWFVTVMALIAAFRVIDPPQSMLMLTKRLGGETLQHEWVPLTQISTSLRRAVITSEDGKFCRHWGFDLGEIRAAMNRTDGFGRGASTITQQLAKNLFLWPGKSYVRKALEVPLTLAIEALWNKKRILEVYLNVAEWGPGVFGAEAAAQYYYNKSATQLTEREAALLAVSLPNPIARDASDPNPAIARRASTLQARMRVQGISYCALTPKAN